MKNLALWPIGNCQVNALVDGAAGMVWACQPQVDGDPLFSSLLEPDREQGGRLPAGEWRIELEDQQAAEAHYLTNTPILVTRLTDTRGGAIDVIDFCPRFERRGRMYRPVAFVRILRPVAGSPRVRVMLNPTVNWGNRTRSGPTARTISATSSSPSLCG